MGFLEVVELITEEMEAFRLRHINDLEQKKAAKRCALLRVPTKEFYIQPTKKSPRRW
jgi:predicted DNA-binding protein (UPF0251 family)